VRTFDLIVIGAGIGGGSLVYNLLRQGFTGSILVLDRGGNIASGASAYSAGGFRNLWTTAINQRLCSRSIQILGRFKEEMGVAIGFQQTGYLFTYYEAAWKQMPKVAEVWRANGVNFDLQTPAEVEARIPGLRCSLAEVDPEVREYLGLEDIKGGVFGRDCGSFDPSQAAVAYFERAMNDFSARPVLKLNTDVEAVTFDAAGRATGVQLRCAGAEETVRAGIVAICTGPWTNELLDCSGCPQEDRMPIAAQKRMLFITDFPDQDPRWQTIPLTLIDHGIHFKYESGSLMIGKARQEGPHNLDTTFEPDYYVDEVNLVMQERMPATATCKLKRGWAHLYDTNIADHNAILGWHGNHPNLLLQVGYSGHGAMESPAVGECLAELILTGRYQTVDCAPLRWSRFREGDLVRETIVI
jgi:glycine/D-amino acid oxidase-like deaminating enzyme